MKEIIVHTQEELDAIPKDCTDKIIIKSEDEIVVSNRYGFSVTVCGTSTVRAYDTSTVTAYDTSTVTACGTSTVRAYGTSTVRAYDTSTVTACGNSQILKESENCQIQTSGNARIVYLPKTADEFLDYYGIKHADGKAILYKAVHKAEKGYCSNYNKDFTYNINETITEKCDRDVNKDCASGIHVAYLDWALCFGGNFDDLAILEVVTDIDKIVVPKNTDGKVRTSEVYVVREVPLEECGILGSIIARRIK